MRSKALPPARAQGHIMPFLEAAALFAALCIFARTAALMLAAAITAPLPMAETLFSVSYTHLTLPTICSV